jgi:hypothetical protein
MSIMRMEQWRKPGTPRKKGQHFYYKVLDWRQGEILRMRRKNASITVLLLCLIISFSLTVSAVLAQDIQSDRSSTRALFIVGNDRTFGGSENFSYAMAVLNGTNPELDLNLNLTVRANLVSENDVKGFDLIIVCAPNATNIPNATIFKNFIENGNPLFLLSNYYGGGSRNSSGILNTILNKSNMSGVSFGSDAISISNATANWRAKVYNNNSLAVNVNSSAFQSNAPTRSVFNDVENIVTMSCKLNITNHNESSFVATGSALSDSNLSDWLLLTDDGVHRSVLCGSASMFNNTYLGVENNQILFRQLVLWLVEKFQLPTPNVFPYLVLASSAVSVLGIAIYLISRRTKTCV